MTTAGLGVLALVAGTAGGIVALTRDDTRVVTAVGRAAPVVELPAAEVPVRPPTGQTGLGDGAVGHAAAAQQADENRSEPGEADRTATRPPRLATGDRGRTGGAAGASGVGGAAVAPGAGGSAGAPGRPAAAAAPAGPRVRVVRVARTEVIPFRTTRVRDASLRAGSREIRAPGAPGQRLLRYAFTYSGNRVTSRRLLGSTVTRTPKDRVIAIGTRKKHADHRDDDRPSADEPGSDEPSGDEPDADEPDADEPDADEPGGDEPAGEPGPDDSDSDDDQECRLLDACVWLDRETECDGDGFDAGHEGIIDDDSGLLDPSDIDEMDLILPCDEEDEDWDDGWDDGEEAVRDRE